jgi:hypothetical protein
MPSATMHLDFNDLDLTQRHAMLPLSVGYREAPDKWHSFEFAVIATWVRDEQNRWGRAMVIVRADDVDQPRPEIRLVVPLNEARNWGLNAEPYAQRIRAFAEQLYHDEGSSNYQRDRAVMRAILRATDEHEMWKGMPHLPPNAGPDDQAVPVAEKPSIAAARETARSLHPPAPIAPQQDDFWDNPRIDLRSHHQSLEASVLRYPGLPTGLTVYHLWVDHGDRSVESTVEIYQKAEVTNHADTTASAPILRQFLWNTRYQGQYTRAVAVIRKCDANQINPWIKLVVPVDHISMWLEDAEEAHEKAQRFCTRVLNGAPDEFGHYPLVELVKTNLRIVIRKMPVLPPWVLGYRYTL